MGKNLLESLSVDELCEVISQIIKLADAAFPRRFTLWLCQASLLLDCLHELEAKISKGCAGGKE